MFNNRDIISAIEIGSSKICVLVGEIGDDGHPEIIGRGLAPSSGTVVKGEVYDMEKALPALAAALDEADNSSGGELGNCRQVTVLVNGCGIDSQAGVGTVFVKNEQGIVTEEERREANENARVFNLAADREIISSSESYWMIDGRRVRNPLRQNAGKLEAHVHVVHGVSSRIENFRSLVRDSGFDNASVEIVFSPIAADMGIISDAERENGVLLVDFGAGCTDYVVEFDNGITASGVLQVGVDHLANDLAIGLDLHIDLCRRLIESGAIGRAVAEHRDFLEFHNSTGGVRRVPLASFESIIDLRLREIFEIIRARLLASGVPRCLGAGGVLTGGGALFYRTPEMFREVFELSCRIGQPGDIGGAITGIDTPRFSAVWGGLKVAAHYLGMYGSRRGGALNGVVDKLNRLLDNSRRGFRNFRESVKF